jgi:hypothetical protein
MSSINRFSRLHDFSLKNECTKSIDHTNPFSLLLFCFRRSMSRRTAWQSPLLSSPPYLKDSPESSELCSCFAVTSGPPLGFPSLSDFPMDGQVHRAAQRTPLKTPRQSLFLSSKSCTSGVSHEKVCLQACLPPQKVIMNLEEMG